MHCVEVRQDRMRDRHERGLLCALHKASGVCRSVNVAGAKLWRLLPAQYTHLLYDRFGREMAPDFDADASRPGHFPNLGAARKHVIQVRQVRLLHTITTTGSDNTRCLPLML